MTAIIIDDEILNRQRIKALITERNEITLLKEFSTGNSAILEIKALKPDVIFIDINLKDVDGFEVLRIIKKSISPIIVVITTFNHALEAFECEAFDFIQKPFTDQRIIKTLEKLIHQESIKTEKFWISQFQNVILSENKHSKDKAKFHIPIRNGSKTVLLNPERVKYLIASGSYVEIHTKDKKFVVRLSLNHLESSFDNSMFFRVHRSFIININYIQELLHGDYSELDVRMKDNKIIRISKSKKKEFVKFLGM